MAGQGIPGLEVFLTGTKPGSMKVMFYGDMGSGKTTAAASAHFHPELGKIAVIDPDGGLIGQKGTFARIHGRTEDQIMKFRDEMLMPDEQRRSMLQGVHTIIVDTLSSWRGGLIDDAQEVRAAKNKHKNEPWIPDKQDYIDRKSVV